MTNYFIKYYKFLLGMQKIWVIFNEHHFICYINLRAICFVNKKWFRPQQDLIPNILEHCDKLLAKMKSELRTELQECGTAFHVGRISLPYYCLVQATRCFDSGDCSNDCNRLLTFVPSVLVPPQTIVNLAVRMILCKWESSQILLTLH